MKPIRPRIEALEAGTVGQRVALLVYRDDAELEEMQARTTAPILLCIPDDGRDNLRGNHEQTN